MRTDIAVIGGGAAGLFAAAVAAGIYRERGVTPSVLILEKMERCGRKIALTGKGRCNITNTKPWEEFARHIHPKNIFLKNAFYAMDNIKTMEFFESMGLPLITERGDRVFPESMRACDVTRVMTDYIRKNGIKIITGANVGKIDYISGNGGKSGVFPEKDFTGGYFGISVSGISQTVIARKVIIATGGLSYPATGSTGDGYELAKRLGHKITLCFPSLTALVPKNYNAALQGISLKNVSVRLSVNGNIAAEEFGDMDFTGGGIEGPLGFKVSRKGVWNLINGQKVELILDMKPALTVKQLSGRIERELAQAGKGYNGSNLDFILMKLLPQSLVKPFIAAHRGLNIAALPDALKNWKFEISSYVGYERCVITAGGVSLSEVSQKTMESKLVPGLYFAGEILDLDGDTGGYNLQIAFSTAALAAMSIIKSIDI